MNVDALTLFAYADKSQQRERELWKRFLLLLLPILLEADGDELAEVFDEAACDDVETALAHAADLSTPAALVRVISGALALSLGLAAEFGIASFVESNPPTRIYAQNSRALRLTDDELMGRWLGRFTRIQDDDEFLGMAADWKERMHALLKGEAREDVDEAIESLHVPRTRRKKSA